MGHKKLTYMIVEAGTIGGPPKGNPVLGDENGKPIPANQLLIFNKTDDNLKKVDHYRITIEIADFKNSSLRFTPNQDDVLWVKAGSGSATCPTSACHDLSDMIWVDPPLHPQGKSIDIINMDLRVEDFWFTLNLVDKNDPTSTNYVPVDPGGGNQNGGFAGSNLTISTAQAITLGAGAGLAAFFGAQLLLNKG